MSAKQLIRFAVLACVAITSSGQPAPVRVTAWGQHYGGQVVYKFEVQNGGSAPVNRLRVGVTPEPNAGAELTELPDFQGITFWVASGAYTAPAGWGAWAHPVDEVDRWSLEWIEASYLRQRYPGAGAMPEAPVPVGGSTGVLPGTTANSFSVAVSQPDFAYVSGRAIVSLGNTDLSVPVVKGDSAPPVVSLDVARLNQNENRGTWALFQVNVSARDNYDPQPDVNFAPISADQSAAAGDIVVDKNSNRAWNVKLKNVPGRTYTFTATATDASGNVGAAIYRYTASQ